MQYDSAYLVGRGSLTPEESFVLELMRPFFGNKRPFGEHEFHMAMKIVQDISGQHSYQFELKWWEHIDERYVTGLGSVPYSAKLHAAVHSLVAKHYLRRDSENPIIIFEDCQLRLF